MWVLFLDSDGTVKARQRINTIEGNFTGVLDFNDDFGSSVASLLSILALAQAVEREGSTLRLLVAGMTGNQFRPDPVWHV